jgi:hypothetical protein
MEEMKLIDILMFAGMNGRTDGRTRVNLNALLLKNYSEFKKENLEVQCSNSMKINPSHFLFVCFGFYVTSTQFRSYRDVPTLLVEEDLR